MTNETISHTIDVMSMSGQPLSPVQFRWAVLINHLGKPLRAEAGTNSHDLKPAEKFSFEAGPIEFRARAAKVDGYYVEAVVSGLKYESPGSKLTRSIMCARSSTG